MPGISVLVVGESILMGVSVTGPGFSLALVESPAITMATITTHPRTRIMVNRSLYKCFLVSSGKTSFLKIAINITIKTSKAIPASPDGLLTEEAIPKSFTMGFPNKMTRTITLI